MSFVAKFFQSAIDQCMHLVLAKTKSGADAWWYILVDKPKMSAFEKAMKTGDVDLADYGKIFASGYGASPSAKVKQEMAEKYNFVEKE
jgi:hypothetical protein